MCHKTLFLSISAPPSLPQQNRTAPPSQTKPSLHLPLCLIGASKLLNTKRLKSSASRPPLLSIKFSHSDQRRRQVAGIVAEHARTMAENDVAIPSLLVPPWAWCPHVICLLRDNDNGYTLFQYWIFFFNNFIQVIYMQIWCRVLQYLWP